MGDMKSAWEIALEKAEAMGEVSQDELYSVKYVPEGNRIATQFLMDEKLDLAAELAAIQPANAVKMVKKGLEEVFLRNIYLPRNEVELKKSNRSIDGLRVIKENKKQLESAIVLINNLVTQYKIALQQTYGEFQKNIDTTIDQLSRNMRPQPGDQMPMDQKIQLQLQEEWRRIQSELDSQYGKALEEHKQKIRQIS